MQFVSFYICIGLKKEKRSKSECCSQMEGKNKCLASIITYCHRTRLRVLFLSKSATFCVLLHDKLTIVSSELQQSHGALELYQWQAFIGHGGYQRRMSRARERQTYFIYDQLNHGNAPFIDNLIPNSCFPQKHIVQHFLVWIPVSQMLTDFAIPLKGKCYTSNS